MRVGVWKSFEELEESLNIPELDLLLKTIGDERKEGMSFQMQLQGINPNEVFGDPLEDKRKEIEQRAAERLGKSRQYEYEEFADIGIELISGGEE